MEKKEKQISPFLVFFLIHKIQLGVGVLGFQRDIIKFAGNDAWIIVIVAAILVSISLWFMYVLLNRHQVDLIDIHKDLFGKWAGGALSIIWIINWILLAVTVFRNYIEIIQVWIFPIINVGMISVIFIILIYYCISGGFKVVAGLSFLGVVIPFYIFMTFLYPLEYANFRNLLPVWNHTITEMALGTKEMMLSYLGFSTLMMFYPFIKNPTKSQKWAHFGNLFTMVLYLFLMITTIVYYSEKQVNRYVWATLSLWQIVEMPFVERLEYIGIVSWLLIILPNISLNIWAATTGAKKIFNIKSNKLLIGLLVLLWLFVILIKNSDTIAKLNQISSMFGMGLIYGYVPILTVISFIILKRRRKKDGKVTN
ncbi:spore germination protein (amino acid permease) [Cytobacillus horneckiae]|uniref:Spore gernimation protein GerB n=1 Tax=Cytobacillus horneckiae TaxID=549687 RepID=A0A2N0ZA65_9BACI|nr:GerAB/ArcD/ProY family transporter [Cytobacillus horneckiae]MBN6886779.1 GerAB/ArcD/ProY family transporter [Cytobacillus horneckiae]MCM3177749.1 spore germination protein [Cytobacillus horneckiae]MEC1158065.1 GerAB/ArcD/ProY family transporter [Cytobacillus horneckiae]MED2937010.1 GerAB/ArcD/ProY family transporter [Cytobacillus horneckiae]PKG26406.1 spore gernimation protein GerB [Cytobacillus horneckiae]